MKRFWVFRFEYYYPDGGIEDLQGGYDTAEEALKAAHEALQLAEYHYPYDCSQVWDVVTGVVRRFSRAHGSNEIREKAA